MASLKFIESSNKTNIESWFISIDIFSISCNVVTIVLAILSLSLIILDKTYRAVSIVLVGNSFFVTLLFGSTMLCATSFTLLKDLKQIQYPNPLCVFIGYMIYVTANLQNYSILLQAIYRYILIVHPTRIFWHSHRIQILFICMSWIIALVLPILYIFTNQIIYDVDNQVCQVHLKLSFSIVYMALTTYMIPVSMVMLIYFILVRYVKRMGTRVTSINTLSRAHRELNMVRRIIVLVTILVIICFPYQLFLVMSFFNSTPKYNFRIAFLFGDTAMGCILITLFIFTDPLKASLWKRIKKRTNVVVPAIF